MRITAGALPRGLHALNLSRNKISTIEGLRELTRLRVLDLSYNRILRIGHGKINLDYNSSLLFVILFAEIIFLMPLSIDIQMFLADLLILSPFFPLLFWFIFSSFAQALHPAHL